MERVLTERVIDVMSHLDQKKQKKTNEAALTLFHHLS